MVTCKSRINDRFLENRLVNREPLPNLWHIPPKMGSAPPNMLDTIIIFVGEQVKRWQRVTLREPVYSLLAVRILQP
jgi:hypothetical protein